MINWRNLDKYDKLFVIWVFALQIILIIHFAIRKPLFESYTMKYGWLVYALCIPSVVISIILMRALAFLGGRISFSSLCNLWILY